MSILAKALKKAQEARQDQKEKVPGEIVFLTDTPKSWIKTTLMAILAVGTITAIILSIEAINLAIKNSESKEVQMLNLEKIIKTQEKRIDDFIVAINKNQKITDSQIHDLNLRLNKENNENKDINLQINNLISQEKANYVRLKEAILDEKQKVDSIEEYTRNLDKKIDALPMSNTQINTASQTVSSQ